MSVWSKNIELLKKKNLYLAEKLRNYKSDDFEIIVSKSGVNTAKYNNIIINSAYNPKEEAKVRVSNIENLSSCTMLLCMGMGLGYEISELIHRVNERCAIILVVFNLNLLRGVMENIDLSEILEYERIAMLDGTDGQYKAQLKEISMQLTMYTSEIEVFIHPVIGRFYADNINDSISYIKELLILDFMHIGNSPDDNLEGLQRILENARHIIKSPDLRKLKGYFKGIPAICVASGPSLEKNIKFLKDAQGKAAIFAAESIIDRLRKENIKIDFASVIERVVQSYNMCFKDKPLEKDVVFLGDAVVYHKIFDEHDGKNIVVFRDTTNIEKSFSSSLGELNAIDIGLSSASQNLAVANYLGFNPIILVGQDLAYGDTGEDHAKGTVYYEEEYKERINKKVPIAHDELWLKGVNGGLVRSNKLWNLFLDYFEKIISENKIDCIDATEGGAYIEGTKVMTLRDAIDTYCKDTIIFKLPELFEEPDEEEVDRRKFIFIEESEKQLADAKATLEICTNALTILDKFIKVNCIDKENYEVKDYVNIINMQVGEISKFSMPAFILQPVSVNLLRKTKGMVNTNDRNIVKKWYELSHEYFDDASKIMKIAVDIYNNMLINVRNEGTSKWKTLN